MAKEKEKAKEQVAESVEIPEESKKKRGFLQLFFVLVIPILSLVVIALVVANLMGINVFQKTKEMAAKIPIVQNFVDVNNGEEATILKQQKVELEAALKEEKLAVKQLEQTVAKKEKEVETLNQQIEQLTAKLKAQEQLAEQEKTQQTANTTNVDLNKTYTAMAPKKVADVIPNLPDAQAVAVLMALKSDKVAEIFEKMQPKDAAKYTNLLAQKLNAPE